jgi:hypothetical protein
MARLRLGITSRLPSSKLHPVEKLNDFSRNIFAKVIESGFKMNIPLPSIDKTQFLQTNEMQHCLGKECALGAREGVERVALIKSLIYAR